MGWISEVASGASGFAALLAVAAHMAVYAYREGRKEERLVAVERRVEQLPAAEVMLATLSSELGAVKEQLGTLRQDLRSDIQEVNHVIRDHLMRRAGS